MMIERIRLHVFTGVVILMAMNHIAIAGDTKVIASFEKPGSAANWVSVNDDVMGGVSTGKAERTEEGALRFRGNLSLENNGGFASIRTKPADLKLKGANGLIITAKGDGRTYWAEVRIAGQMAASSYRAYLKTVKGRYEETYIPLSDFKLQAFGQALPGQPLKPETITSIGFTLADKTPGPFQMDIKTVKAAFGDAPVTGTIVDVAKQAGMFGTLLDAVAAAGLTEALGSKGPFTVFAPTDDAFAKLGDDALVNLLKPENKVQLVNILKYHVIAGKVSLPDALKAKTGTTLQGEPISIEFSDGRVRLGSAILLEADIAASNGVIHVIDAVLIPPKPVIQTLSPVKIVELAIERGVPLFNNGSPEGCAAVYELACESLRSMPDVTEGEKASMTQALTNMRAEKSASEKAWILRRALDSFLARRAGNAE